ncbi:MAG: hypothetical protein Q9M40_02510 [Sulfurimonas sp.]|nr:hypothetical protein [Sulfurimonas sp.]MDQ7066953.1 hypothetical protein [Sulfurimonas sp.]
MSWTFTASATDIAPGIEGNVTITYNVTDIYGATSADQNITFDTNSTI